MQHKVKVKEVELMLIHRNGIDLGSNTHSRNPVCQEDWCTYCVNHVA